MRLPLCITVITHRGSPVKLVPVILSGGAGTRLWPASREAEPKPFIAMPDGQSLLLKTLRRAFGLGTDATIAEVLLVTNRDYLFRTVDERAKMPAGDHPPLRFILEPAGRNTGPAIALAAQAAAAAHGRDAVLIVLPADHLINDVDAFGARRRSRRHWRSRVGSSPSASSRPVRSRASATSNAATAWATAPMRSRASLKSRQSTPPGR